MKAARGHDDAARRERNAVTRVGDRQRSEAVKQQGQPVRTRGIGVLKRDHDVVGPEPCREPGQGGAELALDGREAAGAVLCALSQSRAAFVRSWSGCASAVPVSSVCAIVGPRQSAVQDPCPMCRSDVWMILTVVRYHRSPAGCFPSRARRGAAAPGTGDGSSGDQDSVDDVDDAVGGADVRGGDLGAADAHARGNAVGGDEHAPRPPGATHASRWRGPG